MVASRATWPRGTHGDGGIPYAAIADRVHALLHAAPLAPAYHAAVTTALALPGNVLSPAPTGRWGPLVWICCAAAGGRGEEALPAAAAAELFMVALDVLDDEQDGEETALRSALGVARALNVSTGLLLLAQQSLLATVGAPAADLLARAGLVACSGQDADLGARPGEPLTLDDALDVTAGKSASLVAALCRLGALCAVVATPTQELYARFGHCLGMVLQVTNDLAAIQPGAHGKTDIAQARPTLPLTYAARQRLAHDARPSAAVRTDLWTDGAAFLAWAVAETYRGHAAALIPHLTADPAHRAALGLVLERG